MDKEQFDATGYTVVEEVFAPEELTALADCITGADSSRSGFRKTTDLFAIRQFLQEIPSIRGVATCVRSDHQWEQKKGHTYRARQFISAGGIKLGGEAITVHLINLRK